MFGIKIDYLVVAIFGALLFGTWMSIQVVKGKQDFILIPLSVIVGGFMGLIAWTVIVGTWPLLPGIVIAVLICWLLAKSIEKHGG